MSKRIDASGDSIAPTPEGITSQSVVSQSEKASNTGKVSKAAIIEPPVGAYFATEVKWIAVVTAIIVVLLIASYYIFR